jgi:hypothetical protein
MHKLLTFCKENVDKYPHRKQEICEIYNLCKYEVESGESEAHEVELAYSDLQEIIDEEENHE